VNIFVFPYDCGDEHLMNICDFDVNCAEPGFDPYAIAILPPFEVFHFGA
jgi:hypothetical protein